MTLTVILSILYSFAVSSVIANASELDGYTIVDWSRDRDVESNDSNSVIVGGDIVFWRYVNAENPASGAIWKSTFGDELTDNEVMQIWSGDFGEKYISASVDIDAIPDENIRSYIYNHMEEGVPELKLKFDIDADVPGDDNEKKAANLFKGDVGYRIYRDNNGSDRIELKFSPKFYVIDNDDKTDENTYLPHMPNKTLPRARYPYSSVLFSMWGFEGGNNDHYGALEVIEGNDPRYIYGQSFGYGDVMEKGKIPNNMVYPNFEAGQINPEGNWAGTIEADTLDSNLIRIGQQYKSNGDLWYYSYGGAVGYDFKFPFKVSLAVDIAPKVTKRIINSNTGEILHESTEVLDKETITKSYILADNNGFVLIDNVPNEEYTYNHFEIKRGDNEELINRDDKTVADVSFSDKVNHKILDVYVIPKSKQSKLRIRYIDKETNKEIKSEEKEGRVLDKPEDKDIIEYRIKDIDCMGVEDYVITDVAGNVENTVKYPPNKDVKVTVTGDKPVKILIIHLINTCGTPEDDNIETVPIAPSICDSDTSSITWQEQTRHTFTDGDGYRQTCYHTYTYRATLSVDEVNLSPEILKSGYGMDVNLKTSVSWRSIEQERSIPGCPEKFTGTRNPDNRPAPPTRATARLGWVTKTFGGQFIQDSSVSLKMIRSTVSESEFSAPYNNVVEENKLYTDIWLSGTKEQPRKHKIAFDIYGGGVDGTEWCTTVEKIFTINGDMYEDDGTTST